MNANACLLTIMTLEINLFIPLHLKLQKRIVLKIFFLWESNHQNLMLHTSVSSRFCASNAIKISKNKCKLYIYTIGVVRSHKAPFNMILLIFYCNFYNIIFLMYFLLYQVFFYYANYKSGKLNKTKGNWLTRNELQDILPDRYSKSVKEFLIEETYW